MVAKTTSTYRCEMTPQQTLLKAARVAKPNIQRRIEDGQIVSNDETFAVFVLNDRLIPLYSAMYCHELQIALEWKYKFHQTFKDHLSGKEGGTIFVAEPKIVGPVISAPTKPELLLKCIESYPVEKVGR